ncbi:MAG: hypothetical protein JF597_22615 [Streptomyces sp.]|uniref:hypothetical protein n=1 Tax=Streptomyces sp. TaxID=1931 RepID=UPI0025EF4D17|nr:hypothetical protein [Streptomyces sp.]MBW8796286.1 hypothetical protein [Streptomyces sp.]
MRAQRARRLGATFAASILMAGGAAVSAAGTAAAAPAVHTQAPTDWCFGNNDWRCSDHGGFRFDNRFDNRFDHRFDNRFDNRFDHRFDNGSIVIVVPR